jgi:hypothetical protein
MGLGEETANLLDAAFEGQEPQEETPEAPEARLVYANVYEFVSQWLRFMYRRNVNGKSAYWNATWWNSQEAESRLTELWRTWEYYRQDPIGMAFWWRDFCDPTMSVLLSEDGPFKATWDEDRDRSNGKEPLACAPAPEGMFRDERADGRMPPTKLTGTDPVDARSRVLS